MCTAPRAAQARAEHPSTDGERPKRPTHLEVRGQGGGVEALDAVRAQHLADAVQGAAVQHWAARQALQG